MPSQLMPRTVSVMVALWGVVAIVVAISGLVIVTVGEWVAGVVAIVFSIVIVLFTIGLRRRSHAALTVATGFGALLTIVGVQFTDVVPLIGSGVAVVGAAALALTSVPDSTRDWFRRRLTAHVENAVTVVRTGITCRYGSLGLSAHRTMT